MANVASSDAQKGEADAPLRSAGLCGRSRRLFWLLPAVLLAGAVWLTRPLPSQLVWYTTPPLDDKNIRVRLLIPVGWEGGAVRKSRMEDDPLIEIDIRPAADQRLSLEDIQRGMHRSAERLTIALSGSPAARYGKTPPAAATTKSAEGVNSPNIVRRLFSPSALYTSIFTVQPAKASFQVIVTYERKFQSAFNASHRAIHSSAQVLLSPSRR